MRCIFTSPIVATILIAALSGCGGGSAARNPSNDSTSGNNAGAASPAATGAVSEILSRDLAQEAFDTGRDFSEKYRGKRIRIRGEVGRVAVFSFPIGGVLTEKGDMVMVIMNLRDPDESESLPPCAPITVEATLMNYTPGLSILAFNDGVVVAKETPAPPPEVVAIAAEDLAREFLFSQPGVKYKGSKVRVTGTVYSLLSNGVVLYAGHKRNGVQGTLGLEECDPDEIKDLKDGDKVTMEGEIVDELMNRVVTKCKVISKQQKVGDKP